MTLHALPHSLKREVRKKQIRKMSANLKYFDTGVDTEMFLKLPHLMFLLEIRKLQAFELSK